MNSLNNIHNKISNTPTKLHSTKFQENMYCYCSLHILLIITDLVASLCCLSLCDFILIFNKNII